MIDIQRKNDQIIARVENQKHFCAFSIIVICKWKCLILTRFCYRLLPFLQISQFQKMKKKKNELTVKAVCIYVGF